MVKGSNSFEIRNRVITLLALLMSSFLTSCSIQGLAYTFPEQEFCSFPLLVETWSLDDISLCLQIHLRLGLSGGGSLGKGPGGLSYPVSSNCCSQNLQGSRMHRCELKWYGRRSSQRSWHTFPVCLSPYSPAVTVFLLPWI